jgi:hypothetical protein
MQVGQRLLRKYLTDDRKPVFSAIVTASLRPPSDQRAGNDRPSGTVRIGWAVFAAAYRIFTWLTLSNLRSSLDGDPRRTNPHPNVRPYAPFLGFDNWPVVVTVMSSATAIGLISTAIPLAVLAGLRVTAPKAPGYDQFPYPQLKIYDPYGTLERVGRPGPFYQ